MCYTIKKIGKWGGRETEAFFLKCQFLEPEGFLSTGFKADKNTWLFLQQYQKPREIRYLLILSVPWGNHEYSSGKESGLEKPSVLGTRINDPTIQQKGSVPLLVTSLRYVVVGWGERMKQTGNKWKLWCLKELFWQTPQSYLVIILIFFLENKTNIPNQMDVVERKGLLSGFGMSVPFVGGGNVLVSLPCSRSS